MSWVGRHRALAAFAAGALVTVVAFGAVLAFVLTDQRRTARVLAAALSRAFAREIRIERVTEVGTARVVMRGVAVTDKAGGLVSLEADRVEATGPLLAAARGDAAPVQVQVTGPSVTLPVASGPAEGLSLADLHQRLADLLAGSVMLDVALTGGQLRGGAGPLEFDATLRKSAGAATAEVTLRAPRQAPLVLTLTARLEGTTLRASIQGGGTVAPLAAWLGDPAGTALGSRPLRLSANLQLGPAGTLTADGQLAVGDVMALSGSGSLKDGVLELALRDGAADLGLAAAVAGLGWQPTGRLEVAEAALRWPPGSGGGATLRASVRVPTLGIPAAAGAPIAVEGFEGQLALEPAPPGFRLHGAVRVARIRTGWSEIVPAESRYGITLDARGGVVRAELDPLRLGLHGATFAGTAGYEGATGRVDADLRARDVAAGPLVRRLGAGWLAPADGLALGELRLTAAGLDPRGLRAGALGLEARSWGLTRAEGELAGRRVSVHATLGDARVTLRFEADRVVGALPAFEGEFPEIRGQAELERTDDGSFRPAQADLTARDAQAREMLGVTLRPAATAGRLALSATAPALERLDGLWPKLSRRLHGAARLDAEIGTAGRGIEGRLSLDVPEVELQDGQISIRELRGDIPVRREHDELGEPPWGTLSVGEVIAAGVIVRDVTTPARVWKDRLSLNDLTYALYSGVGKGWSELELAAGAPRVRGQLTGERVRIEEFIGAYGIRGGTMTGLLRYDLGFEYRSGRLGLKGRLEVPDGGTVSIELLNRLLSYAPADPTGVLRSALESLRAFDYKSAQAEIVSAGDDIRVNLSLRGRERFLIFPARVAEINVRNMPVSFLGRQFPGI